MTLQDLRFLMLWYDVPYYYLLHVSGLFYLGATHSSKFLNFINKYNLMHLPLDIKLCINT